MKRVFGAVLTVAFAISVTGGAVLAEPPIRENNQPCDALVLAAKAGSEDATLIKALRFGEIMEQQDCTV